MKKLTSIYVFIALIASGCMDSLHDYDNCVKIETARCKVRAKCDLGFDDDTCIAYYKEFCRTRQIKGPDSNDATKTRVTACVEAISALAGDCNLFDPTVNETQKLSECYFLWPEDSEKNTDKVDAGKDAS